jgi:hypothetical protein
MRTAGLVLFFLSFSLLVGCKPDVDKERNAALNLAAPLELDPTEHYDISRWWSNGKQLLRLDQNSSYALYGSQNRYEKPLERGRWSKQDYATLWLEPYTDLKHERHRVRVTKISGRIAMQVRSLDPMFAIQAPPRAPEDSLIGQWNGPLGTLNLQPDMRYAFVPAPANRRGTAVVGHSGTWALVNGAPALKPDTPSVPPLQLGLRTADDDIVLLSDQGELHKVQ